MFCSINIVLNDKREKEIDRERAKWRSELKAKSRTKCGESSIYLNVGASLKSGASAGY